MWALCQCRAGGFGAGGVEKGGCTFLVYDSGPVGIGDGCQRARRSRGTPRSVRGLGRLG